MRSLALRVKGLLCWDGPLRFMLWRWRASAKDRAALKRRVRELERRPR